MRQRRDRRLTNLAHRLQTAATLTPNIQTQLAHQLAHCDTHTPTETGPTAGGNPYTDPVLQTVIARSHIITRQRNLENAINRLETAVNELDTAIRQTHIRHTPEEQPPICHTAGCTQEVSSYKRADGTDGYRMTGEQGGLCNRHRMQARRETKQTA